jgi:hypothetical protein
MPATKKGRPGRDGPFETLLSESAYGAFVALPDIGAVAAASLAALLAAMAEFAAAFEEDIAAFASDAAALEASPALVAASGFLQAATETAATAALTIRIVRSVPEVMFLVPSG